MKQYKRFCLLAVLGLVIAATPFVHGQILWTGPTTNFDKPNSGTSDTILPKSVVLTRGGNQVLYNTAANESSASSSASPKGTEWAFGALSNYNTLSYSSMEALRNNAGGDLSLYITNQPMVLHLINSNIYVSIFFVSWQMQGGDFNYIRSTPAVAAPTPTVSITNPANGATFTAPASVMIQATASVSSGSVTNVSFYNATALLGAATAPPFAFTANNLGAGAYNLTAVATAAGVSATSSVVSITVNRPAPSVAITNPVAGAVFTAPANLSLGASASVASGAVTNVSFFAGTTLLGTAVASPFALTSGVALGAGSYGLTAVATAAGISATSAVVSISVVTPVVVTNSAPSISGGHFSFNYTANPGLVYVIKGSSDLINWTPLATNTASAGSATFTDTGALGGERFYEVVLQPNP